MRVLLTVASFLPSYGGPALSVSRLGAALAAQGADVALWAPDGSALTSSVIDDVAGRAPGMTIARLPAEFGRALDAAGRLDVIHDNGLWLPYNHAVAKAATERGIIRIVSTRGMLEPWAFKYKAHKKRLAWLIYQKRDLSRAQAIHATAEQEALNLRRFDLPCPIFVAPNGMDLPPKFPQRRYDHRKMLFISRVHPKKGLPLLVEAFARLRPKGWQVIIAGPDELGHTAELVAMIEAAGLEDAFQFVGPKYGDDKERLFNEADIFILPTHSENFGIVVAEALARQVPVLTTTGAPWAELIKHRCGWRVDVSVDGIAEGLAAAVSTDPKELRAMGARGRAQIAEAYGWEGIAALVSQNYADVITQIKEQRLIGSAT